MFFFKNPSITRGFNAQTLDDVKSQVPSQCQGRRVRTKETTVSGFRQKTQTDWTKKSALEFGYSPYPTKPPNSMFEFRVSLVCRCAGVPPQSWCYTAKACHYPATLVMGQPFLLAITKPDWLWLWLWETLAIQKMLWEPCWAVVSIFFFFYSYLGKWSNLTISFQSTSHIPWKKVPQAQQKNKYARPPVLYPPQDFHIFVWVNIIATSHDRKLPQKIVYNYGNLRVVSRGNPGWWNLPFVQILGTHWRSK